MEKIVCSVVDKPIILPYKYLNKKSATYQKLQLQIAKKINSPLTMDIQHYTQQELLNKLLNLSLSSSPQKIQPRQSNTLIASQMPHEINPNHIDQYNKLFLHRLAVLGKRIHFSKVHRIEEVEERLGMINIVGIFKRIQVKRVRAFQKNYEEYYESGRNIYDEKDILELEDASGKLKFRLSANVKLHGKIIKPTDLPYGIVIGLTGKNNDQKMQFVVQKITLPSPPPQKFFPTQKYHSARQTLIMCSPDLQKIEYILKQVCDQNNLSVYRSIKSIIVVGFDHKLVANQYRQLDEIFDKYANCIDIYVMPDQKFGEIYPQRPLHPILFPRSYSRIGLVNNPQAFHPNSSDQSAQDIDPASLSGQILISSGQNIKDLLKNCSYGQSNLDNLQSLIEYSHLAPTCPFSLKCQMMQQDYLIINQLPYVFIVGGREKTEYRTYTTNAGSKVKLIAIKGGENVLLDIDSHYLKKFNIQGASAV